jgi:lipoprotein-anchoring transpeptidase ErfK/SrfK
VKRAAQLAGAVAASAIAGLLWTGFDFGHAHGPASAESYAALPRAPAPALKVGRPDPLGSGRDLSRWTIVRISTAARAAPSASAPVVGQLATAAPEGTPNAVSVLRARTAADGTLWVDTRLPLLPNGTTGWVPRRSLGPYETVDTRLVVDRARLRVSLYRHGHVVFTAPAGVGTSASPTPAGHFIVRNELTRYASAFYGPVAFGTTARSAVLTDWPDGGFVGIHGTNEPRLVPGRVSHGCIRLRNRDILRLAALMPIGTPVTIR